ncbi:nicotinate phosphoribosyltransferase [Aureibacter tunicatorum]|uniref:Nicotinamide phosphoribosyltransferase n=1 Tax=Aureibacter tunicatorum TaxID=866807 RepID=A0AAE4BTH1_9BACT|nr:nicotinate phosphoribosyltransferase [Aureibacter tunicatorum]MDR6239833.1 nicotinamide phosphoribosyltransferase [Aureibacter tunicatorum]BDD04308.1 nicotinate phosphoribosyltransferase [Aureibacter tunicatorum]
MLSEDNIILKTDSYKTTHWKQYPPKTEFVYSYLESRGGKFPKTLFFGLQYILKKHFLGQQVTKAKIDEAQEFWNNHFGFDAFNRAGWEYILNKHDGVLPIRVKAVAEGTSVPIENVLLTIENTDPNLYWLTNYLETLLVQVWYPTTIATNSFECKSLIKRYLESTSEFPEEVLPTRLHDFGFRGVSCFEQSALGSAAHLVNFSGTDTPTGIILAQNYYAADMCGHSIPASEHSSITTWGKEHEKDAYRNILTQFPQGLVACVSDSYDVYHAVEKFWGEDLKSEILSRNGVLVIRPDSGDPVEVNSRIFELLWDKFGGRYNQKGYRVLDNHVRVIQGDGVDINTIEKVLLMMKNRGFSAENIAFGSGGGLLQKFDRDTQKFAMKCSFAQINGEGTNVFKDPITSKAKRSKRGRLKLHPENSHFRTISSAEMSPQMYHSYCDKLEVVFENGELLVDSRFDEIKERANKYLSVSTYA